MVHACSSGTLTNVLPHWNAIPHTQGMTLHHVKVYIHTSSRVKDWHARCCFIPKKRQRACQSLTREDDRQRADMSLWYPLNIKLEATTTHLDILGMTRQNHPSSTVAIAISKLLGHSAIATSNSCESKGLMITDRNYVNAYPNIYQYVFDDMKVYNHRFRTFSDTLRMKQDR